MVGTMDTTMHRLANTANSRFFIFFPPLPQWDAAFFVAANAKQAIIRLPAVTAGTTVYTSGFVIQRFAKFAGVLNGQHDTLPGRDSPTSPDIFQIPFSELHHIGETVLSSPFEEITLFFYCIERERFCKEKDGLAGGGSSLCSGGANFATESLMPTLYDG